MPDLIQDLRDRADWNAKERERQLPRGYAYTVGDEKMDRDAAEEIEKLRSALFSASVVINRMDDDAEKPGEVRAILEMINAAMATNT